MNQGLQGWFAFLRRESSLKLAHILLMTEDHLNRCSSYDCGTLDMLTAVNIGAD